MVEAYPCPVRSLRIPAAAVVVVVLVVATARGLGWSVQRAAYLAPVIVVGFAAVAGLLILWGKVAVQQLRETRRPRLVLTLWVVVLAHEVDRGRDGEVRRRVSRSLQLGAGPERRRLLVAPARDDAVDALLPLGTHVQETGALRCAQPFVAVPGVEVRAERVEIE